MPTFDWAAFAQRAFQWLTRLVLFRALLGFLGLALNLFKTPLFLGALVLALTYFPDTIQWVLLQIGQIQIKCFMLVLTTMMPDIFTFGSADVNSWAAIWQQGMNALPADVVDVMNAVGVAELIGLCTSTLMAGSMMVVYRKIMTRAGLL